MKRIITILFFLRFSFVNCQTKTIDSLLRVLYTLKDDTNKVIALNNLSWELSQTDPEKARSYSDKAIDLAASLNYESGLLTARKQKANVLFVLGDFTGSEKIYQELIDAYRKSGNSVELGKIYSNLSGVCDQKGDYEKGADYLVKALRLFEKLNESDLIIPVMLNLGNNYAQRKDIQKAIEYYIKAIQISLSSKNPHYLSKLYTCLGTSYTQLKSYPKAFESFGLAEKALINENNDYGLADLYINMSNYYIGFGNQKKARAYSFRALEKYGNGCQPSDLVICLSNLAATYFNEAETLNERYRSVYYDSCYYYLDSAFTLCRSYALKGLEMDVHKRLSELFVKKKDLNQALAHLIQYQLIHDSLLSVEKETRINELSTKYEVEKKENENLVLSQKNKQQKYTIIVVVLAFIIALSFVWLLFKQNKLRSEQRALSLEQKLLRLQMNPHFIFNSLTAIESYIYENKPEIAGKYLSDFSRLMRTILENSREDLISLESEINTLHYFLRLQQLNLNDSFSYDIHVDDALNIEKLRVPPMLFQPFIENAIKHGIAGVKHGYINVSFKKSSNYLIVEIADNGKGIQVKNAHTQHRSLSISITKERLSILKIKDQKISFRITDNKPSGTKVSFSILIA